MFWVSFPTTTGTECVIWTGQDASTSSTSISSCLLPLLASNVAASACPRLPMVSCWVWEILLLEPLNRSRKAHPKQIWKVKQKIVFKNWNWKVLQCFKTNEKQRITSIYSYCWSISRIDMFGIWSALNRLWKGLYRSRLIEKAWRSLKNGLSILARFRHCKIVKWSWICWREQWR